MTAGNILETRGLEKRFGGVIAVSSVDFKLKQRELRCLIGPNGAGKSTFFKMLTAQLKPTTGQIFFDGVDITKAQTHQISRMGIGIEESGAGRIQQSDSAREYRDCGPLPTRQGEGRCYVSGSDGASVFDASVTPTSRRAGTRTPSVGRARYGSRHGAKAHPAR